MIHLDANYLVGISTPASPEVIQVGEWIAAGQDIGTSSVAWAEYLCGPLSLETLEATRELVGEPVPFGERDAGLAAEIFNSTGRRRSLFRDCMIGAVASNAGASVATNNIVDFRRFAAFGVRIASD